MILHDLIALAALGMIAGAALLVLLLLLRGVDDPRAEADPDKTVPVSVHDGIRWEQTGTWARRSDLVRVETVYGEVFYRHPTNCEEPGSTLSLRAPGP